MRHAVMGHAIGNGVAPQDVHAHGELAWLSCSIPSWAEGGQPSEPDGEARRRLSPLLPLQPLLGHAHPHLGQRGL